MSLKEEIKNGLACDSIKDAETVGERAVCLAAHPGKLALWPIVRWYEKRYKGKFRFAQAVFAIDLFLVGLVVGLGLTALLLPFYRPVAFEEKILFAAEVAPIEIVSGASSTLVIRFENNTGEELRDARLTFEFPEHFLLQDVEEQSLGGDFIDSLARIQIGTVPAGDARSIKIRGVMFGSVGGTQTFRSILSFAHGNKNIPGTKIGEHVFSPTRSTLRLSLLLPEKILAFQPMNGTLAYENTGETDYPEISIIPEWPEGFTLSTSDVAVRDGAFALPALRAGTGGSMSFLGRIGNVSKPIVFRFRPAFSFGRDTYEQETLEQIAEIVPPPIRVTHSVDTDTVRPGRSAKVTVAYENVGDTAVENVRLSVSTDGPFAVKKVVETETAVARVEPGQTGTAVLFIPLRSSIEQSATSTYESIPFWTTASATFDMAELERATVTDQVVTTTMTSPVVLSSFGRYATQGGDQIGRGPLPPLVGETTKYWVFWNLRGTTNALENVRIEGNLGPNVSFTGRQTDATGNGVLYDASAGEASWTTALLSPTLSPASKIVGVAFEVAVTPDEGQIGSVPTLLTNVRVTATDAVTGAFVSTSGATITTNLPGDAMADGFATVE